MSRWRDAGSDLSAATLRIGCVATGAVVAVAAATPAAVPTLFGHKWDEAIPVLPGHIGPVLALALATTCIPGLPGRLVALALGPTVWSMFDSCDRRSVALRGAAVPVPARGGGRHIAAVQAHGAPAGGHAAPGQAS